jgi:hypothetical protein
MIQICYDEITNKIKFTINGDKIPAGLEDSAWISVEDQELGDLSSWSVINGNLEFTNLEPTILAFRTAVNAKRLQIISAGIDVSITGYGIVALQGRPEDQTSLQGLAFGAQLRLAMGDSTTKMEFLDRENVLHELTPAQMLELWQKGAGFVSAIYAKSWIIKEMNPMTTDYNEPALWAI